METITYELNGQKYLMMERLVTTSTKDVLNISIKKHGVIEQGIKEIHAGGLFSSGYAVVKLLVPEINILAFNGETS